MAPVIRHYGCLLALKALEAESLTRAAMGFLRSGGGCFSSAAGACDWLGRGIGSSSSSAACTSAAVGRTLGSIAMQACQRSTAPWGQSCGTLRHQAQLRSVSGKESAVVFLLLWLLVHTDASCGPALWCDAHRTL